MSSTSQWICGRGSLLIAILIVGVGFVRTIRNTSMRQLAHKIDESQATGGQIMTGWDLLQDLETYKSPLTARFARQAIRQSNQHLSTIAPAPAPLS